MGSIQQTLAGNKVHGEYYVLTTEIIRDLITFTI